MLTSVVVGASGFQAMLWAETRGVGLLNLVALPLWVVVPVGLPARRPRGLPVPSAESHVALGVAAARGASLRSASRYDEHRAHASAARARDDRVARAGRVRAGHPAVGEPAARRGGRAAGRAAPRELSLARARRPRCCAGAFVTPAMHKLHHSPERASTNANFGGLFSFWDRLCGTYREPVVDACGVRPRETQPRRAISRCGACSSRRCGRAGYPQL